MVFYHRETCPSLSCSREKANAADLREHRSKSPPFAKGDLAGIDEPSAALHITGLQTFPESKFFLDELRHFS